MLTHPAGFTVDVDNGVVYGRGGKQVGCYTPGNYTRIHTFRNGKRISFAVHRIVWEAANGPIPKGLEVNHINGRKDDNRLVNLELVTHAENIQHAFRTGLQSNAGERHPSAKLTEADVRRIRQMRAQGMSLSAIAAHFPVNLRSIHNVVLGKTWAEVA